jgi:hypothetical protein
MYKAKDYWKSHTTMSGKNDHYSQGSVADREGKYDQMTAPFKKKKNPSGYGFGSKKKAKRLGGGY